MRQLYLAATGQNRGKTTVALGLLDGFVSRGHRTGFTKPVGQRTVIEDGHPADEDAVLMRATFDLADPYPAMSPVHIPRGFTRRYIAGEVVEDLGSRILEAQRHFADRDLLLIEGTGHAGVGAVIGLSNAVVASMLGAPAVIVSEGGVGRPIDEIVLNASHFKAHGVPVAGAPRDPAAGRPAVPDDPVQSHPGDDPRGCWRPAHPARARHGPRDRQRGHRSDGATPHAESREPRDAPDRAR
jgi:dethiobiotin synthetase